MVRSALADVRVGHVQAGHLAFPPAATGSITEGKTRQASRIKDVGAAMTAVGLVTLDEQAKALGLSRSTTWTILRANHKASGLSAATINRMLSAPQLPALVRMQILAYIEEKRAGRYCHNRAQVSRFVARLHSFGDLTAIARCPICDEPPWCCDIRRAVIVDIGLRVPRRSDSSVRPQP
jgi:predicted DNA-binding transcriptional regulator AlpA